MNNQQSTFKLLVILALLAILIMAGYMIFGKKNLTAPARTGAATLSWNANTEPDLAGYRIYYGIEKRTGDCPSAGYPKKIDAGKTNTPEKPGYKLENLEIGKTYYFSITSYDTAGNESCFSDEMSKSVK